MQKNIFKLLRLLMLSIGISIWQGLQYASLYYSFILFQNDNFSPVGVALALLFAFSFVATIVFLTNILFDLWIAINDGAKGLSVDIW